MPAVASAQHSRLFPVVVGKSSHYHYQDCKRTMEAHYRWIWPLAPFLVSHYHADQWSLSQFHVYPTLIMSTGGTSNDHISSYHDHRWKLPGKVRELLSQAKEAVQLSRHLWFDHIDHHINYLWSSHQLSMITSIILISRTDKDPLLDYFEAKMGSRWKVKYSNQAVRTRCLEAGRYTGLKVMSNRWKSDIIHEQAENTCKCRQKQMLLSL